MKTAFLPALFALLLGCMTDVSAIGPVEFGADASLLSKYIWRGAAINNEPVLQPSVTAGFMGFSLNLWGNIDLTDFRNEQSSMTEIDYTLTWSGDIPLGQVSAGAVRYTYPAIKGDDPTTELIFGLETTLPGSPTLTFYRDIDKAEGFYILLGAGQSLPLGMLTNLDVSASIGWGSAAHNRYNYDIKNMKNACTDAAVTLGVPFGLGETLSVAPTVSYIFRLNKEMRNTYDSGAAVFGITASAGF